MYNGIGLTTPRGSGTNGHVQRNWAFVRPGKKDSASVTYKTDEDLAKLDAQANKGPNQEILDHERKRKIEVKCAELEEILEKQGYPLNEIMDKVDAYRLKLLNVGREDVPRDEFGRIQVRETHQIAAAQQEKNAKLREAFGISEYFMEGTSLDPERKAKEDLAKSVALQAELLAQRQAERLRSKKYALVRTPSPEKEEPKEKKKKKKKSRDLSSSPERKKEKKSKKSKKKKSKKKKSSKKARADTDSDSSDSASDSDDSDSEDDRKRKRSSKKDKDSSQGRSLISC
ncbi:serine/arginine repetitive matrix protein 2 isoform X4 [Phlebotomus papatasi]|nr:serine/arginine repetitive matrix protein 2 isoform X4 [Phlebotomus papatasi]